MTNKKIFLLAISSVFLLSCTSHNKKIETGDIQSQLKNRDHIIQIDDDCIGCAVYKNLWSYDFYEVKNDSVFEKKENLTFFNQNLKNKIYIGMDKEMLKKFKCSPAYEDENRFIYFQRYIDFRIFQIHTGISRCIIEISFDNNTITSIEEKYVSRP